MTRRDRRASRRAFTMIEAITALVLVAIMVPPTLVLISDAQVRRSSPVLASRARWLVIEKLEDIIADRHSTTRGWAYITAANYPAEPAVAGFAGFARGVAVAETAADLASPGTGYKRVTVTVSWTDPRSGSASLAIQTVLTDYTP